MSEPVSQIQDRLTWRWRPYMPSTPQVLREGQSSLGPLVKVDASGVARTAAKRERARRAAADDDCPLLDMLLEDLALPEQLVDDAQVPTDRDPAPLPPAPRRFIDTGAGRRTLH